jgi:hypothetical protein
VTLTAVAADDDRPWRWLRSPRNRSSRYATAKIGGGEDRIERVYRWQFERALAAVRAAFVAAGWILAGALTAIIRGGVPFASWRTLIVATALVGSVAVAVCQYVRLGRLYGKYLESLRVFAVVQRRLETEQWIRSRSS